MSLFAANELSPGPLTLEQVRRTLWMGMCLHTCNFVIGLVGLFLSLIFRTSEAEANLLRALEMQRSSHSCASILFLSTILLTISGLLGILSQFLGYPKLSTFMIPALAGLAWGISCYGLLEAVVINIGVYQDFLARSFIRESYNMRLLGRIHSVFGYRKEWDDQFQTTLKCCGIADKKDWFLSRYNSIPPSCCKDTARESCGTSFMQRGNQGLGFSPQPYNHVHENLWKDTCLSRANNVVADTRDNWIAGMLVFLCIDIWLFLHVTYFCFIVQELHQNDCGRDQLLELKGLRLCKIKLGLERFPFVGVLYNALKKARRKELITPSIESRLIPFQEQHPRRKHRVYEHLNEIKSHINCKVKQPGFVSMQ